MTTEFQSINLTVPAAMACESWYMAVEAWAAEEPDAAARLEIPLMALTDSFSPTPAAVKVPMLRVISPKLYIV